MCTDIIKPRLTEVIEITTVYWRGDHGVKGGGLTSLEWLIRYTSNKTSGYDESLELLAETHFTTYCKKIFVQRIKIRDHVLRFFFIIAIPRRCNNDYNVHPSAKAWGNFIRVMIFMYSTARHAWLGKNWLFKALMHASMPYFEFVITQKHHGSFNVTKTNGMLTPSLPESSLCAHVMGTDYILHGSVFFF